ncbi:General negative regulator of transcription subunit 4 [Bienertia sinuspersici]
MASYKNGSVARRSNRDKLSKNYYGNRISTYSVSCSSSCSEDDGCLDDWEAVADALIAENNRKTSKTEHHYQGGNRAWSPDDVYRPRSLPSVSKKHYKQSVVPQQQQKQNPSACPICYEDFEVTDSSFEPCPYGFQVSLFCHKKIIEIDGRCPGCKKHYDSMETNGDLPARTTHSCSKNTLV